MIAHFCDHPFFQHIDPVRMHDRRKPVCDQDRDLFTIRGDRADRTRDIFLSERIQCRGGFVKDQQGELVAAPR